VRRRNAPAAPASSNETSEAFRVLRSNLLVGLGDLERPTVLVTSANEGEGKTSTCAALARSFAMAGKRTVVLDLDLRHPDIHHRLGGHNEVGVTDVLLRRRSLEDCLQLIEVGAGPRGAPRSLYLLATGPRVDDPTELLGAARTGRLLDEISSQADIVLVDTPPILPVADTLVIGRFAAGALLVVEARRTPIPSVQRAKDALIRNQTRLLGMVVNKLSPSDGYGYGYGYGYGDRDGSDADEQ
jgi:capsular exopolysaccharide synthesis family protein